MHILFRIVFILSFTTILLSANKSQAQLIKGVAILGLNASQVDGDEVWGYHKFGLNAGVSAIVPFDKKGRWQLVLETIFNQKGAYQNQPPSEDTLGLPYYNLRLNYLEVPVLLNFADRNGLTFGLGVSWGRLIGISEIEHGKKIESTTLAGPYKRNDFNILAEIRFKIYKQLKFNFRYAYTISPIRNRTFVNPTTGATWERTQYNSLLSFRLIYVFNEPSKELSQKTGSNQ